MEVDGRGDRKEVAGTYTYMPYNITVTASHRAYWYRCFLPVALFPLFRSPVSVVWKEKMCLFAVSPLMGFPWKLLVLVWILVETMHKVGGGRHEK